MARNGFMTVETTNLTGSVCFSLQGTKDIENGTVMGGQSLNVLNDVLSCQEVMDRLIAEAKEAIERIKGIEF